IRRLGPLSAAVALASPPLPPTTDEAPDQREGASGNVTTAAAVAEDQKSSDAVLGLGGVTIEFYGGKLNEVSYSDPATMKKYTRRAQLREILELVRATLKFSGVFHTSPR
ncbi:hypothetical protein Goshw_025993, partial [Gossypium schwendimanii]|nr:hypothetical protein [Gossypium schwendimanii]